MWFDCRTQKASQPFHQFWHVFCVIYTVVQVYIIQFITSNPCQGFSHKGLPKTKGYSYVGKLVPYLIFRLERASSHHSKRKMQAACSPKKLWRDGRLRRIQVSLSGYFSIFSTRQCCKLWNNPSWCSLSHIDMPGKNRKIVVQQKSNQSVLFAWKRVISHLNGKLITNKYEMVTWKNYMEKLCFFY